MDLRDLLSVLRTRWIPIVAVTVLGALAALGLSLLTTPVYQSKIQFYVSVMGSEGAAVSAYQGSLGAQQRVQSYAALVQSADITGQVVEAVGVDLAPREVADRVAATANERTVLLDLEVSDSDPLRAFKIAEGYGQVLPGAIERLETSTVGGPPLASLVVSDPASMPTDPVFPKTAQNVGIGLIVGLLVGIGTALLASVFDRRVKTKEQVQELAGAPVVGAIPFRGAADREENAEHLVPFRKGHSPAAEAFRRLRTNLQFLNVDNPPSVIVLTSSVPVEGKSETAVNLSLALAEGGSKVLLVEADMRRPRVVSYMSMQDSVGLTNILTGQATFDDVVQGTQHEGLDLLACGPLPPNPSELLASDTASRLLGDLRSRYDFVIIDSPPLIPVTDGAVLAQIADGALLVVRSQRTTTDQVAQAVDNLAKADAELLGLIMVANRKVRRGTSEYYDSYYYSSKA